MNEKQRLKVYDILRMFHKNELFELLYRKDLTDNERATLETLSGVLYLMEREFATELL